VVVHVDPAEKLAPAISSGADFEVDLCTRRPAVQDDSEDTAFSLQLDEALNAILSGPSHLLPGMGGPSFEDLGLPPFDDDMDAGL
jgi:hypothetical protein